MSHKARREMNGYSIRERRNTVGLRQLNAEQAPARVKSPSKARPMRVAAQKPQNFVIGLGIVESTTTFGLCLVLRLLDQQLGGLRQLNAKQAPARVARGI